MIKLAKRENIEDVYTLICSLESTILNKEQFIKRYNQNIEKENLYYYIYEKQGKVIGFVSLVIKTPLHHDRSVGEIEELIIDEKYRSLGIGKEIIDYIKQIANNMNLEEIEVSSNMSREKAHQFYEKNDFMKSHYKFIRKE